MAMKKSRKKAKRKGSSARAKASASHGKGLRLSRAKGHKPLALLESFHRKMEKNLGKLEGVIRRRRAAGE
jgi:hypothetical protein